jgi:hypothetical protein
MAMLTILVLIAQKLRAPHYSIPIVIALLNSDKRDASVQGIALDVTPATQEAPVRFHRGTFETAKRAITRNGARGIDRPA